MKKQLLKRRLRLALSAIYLVAMFWWFRSTGDSRQALLALVLTLLLGSFLGFVGLSYRIKSAFLRLFAPHSLRVGSADEFPHLDRAAWESLTQSWRHLGFELGVDRAGNMDNPAYGQTFSRTLEHPTQGATAEISQTWMPDHAEPITLSLASLWGERAPVFAMAAQLQRAADAPLAPLAAPAAQPAATPTDLPDEMEMWMLITHNRVPNKFWLLMRQKRLLSRRLPRDATPETLWHAHLEQRVLVEARLQLPHETGDLGSLLEAHGLVLSAQLRARLERTKAWRFGAVRFFGAQAPAVYDGELPA